MGNIGHCLEAISCFLCEIIHLSFFSLLLPGLCPFPWRKIPQHLVSRLEQDPYTFYFQVLSPFFATCDTAQFWSSPLPLLLTQACPAWIKKLVYFVRFFTCFSFGTKRKGRVPFQSSSHSRVSWPYAHTLCFWAWARPAGCAGVVTVCTYLIAAIPTLPVEKEQERQHGSMQRVN